MGETVHKSVLLNESIDGLTLKEGAMMLDGTLGGGGHSAEVVKRFGNGVKIIALDRDAEAIARAKKLFSEAGSDIHFYELNFKDFDRALTKEGGTKINAALLDLGLSSDQLDASGRGFTFRKDEPLLMTMKAEPDPGDLTARDIVNGYKEEELADIIYRYGEERMSRRIAKAIVERRRQKRIETSGDLAEIIERAIGRRGKIHPATKTFQALRIAVNDEQGALERFLSKIPEHVASGARIAIISFHSLEDRMVKNFFRKLEDEGAGKRITKKPIVPGREEETENKRARSAKLRIFEIK